MKATITNISNRFLQRYTLSKKVVDGYKIDEINSEIIYQNEDHDYLVTAAVQGLENETGTIEKECGEDTFTRNVVLRHSQGIFDLKSCVTKKQLYFENDLDCIANKTINIFDYSPVETKTIQGELQRITEARTYYKRLDNVEFAGRLTLEQALEIVGPLNDYSFSYLSYFLEYAQIIMRPVTEFLTDPTYGQYENYITTEFTITANYVRFYSATQITDDWLPVLGGGYAYSKLSQDLGGWGPELAGEVYIIDPVPGGQTATYQAGQWYNGRLNRYVARTVSNTYTLNEILTDIFQCTGKTLISNWFGIDADGTEPMNKYYEFSASFCQDMRIAQSFDIIRESAIKDSFAQSGLIKVKELIGDLLFLFNLYFVVDGTNIRLEHKTYFTRKGIDITLKDYEFSDLEINKDRIDTETFIYKVNFDNPTHWKAVYEYSTPNLYERPNDVSRTTEKLLSDLGNSMNNEDYNKREYEDYFFLLSTDGTSVIGLNSMLSMSNLVKELHDLDRPLKSAILNGTKVFFQNYSVGLGGEIKLKSSPLMWDRLQPYMSVVTKYGTYIIEETEINESDVLTLKIKK